MDWLQLFKSPKCTPEAHILQQVTPSALNPCQVVPLMDGLNVQVYEHIEAILIQTTKTVNEKWQVETSPTQ